jgi:glycosyltransferase involved in cell wall biosynthesis
MLASCYPSEKNPFSCLFLKELSDVLEKEPLNHHVISLEGMSIMEMLKKRKEFKKRVDEKNIDIIHAQFGYSAGFFGALIKRKRKFIVTIHRFELFKKKTLPLLKYGMRKADKIIAVSEYIKREILDIDRRLEDKIIVMPNGVKVEKFTAKNIEGNMKNPLKIGTLAHHSTRKRIHDLIEAFSLLQKDKNDVELYIAGKGPETQNLKNLAESLKLNNVNFLGSISEEEKVDLYSNLDIFALSSDSEGHPVALLESMCSGACPVSSNIPSVEETVIHEKTGLLHECGDVESLYELLKRLEENREELLKYRKEARKIVTEKYNLNERARKLVDIYKKLI